MEEYSDDYVKWLENTLFCFLTNNKNLSDEKIIKKLDAKGIKCHHEFSKYLSKCIEENKIKTKLPFLRTYPISLSRDIYEDDIERINEWEVKTINKIYDKLREEHKLVTPDIYYVFFNNEIVPYKEYFLDETYEKILPQNVTERWFYRINKDIPWNSNNIGIDTISLVESDYLEIKNPMYKYNHLIGTVD